MTETDFKSDSDSAQLLVSLEALKHRGMKPFQVASLSHESLSPGRVAGLIVERIKINEQATMSMVLVSEKVATSMNIRIPTSMF